jgi:acyl-CoA thioesterase FadM
MFAKDLTLPARNLIVDFLRPLTWDDEIEIRASLVEMRTHAYTVQVVALNASGDIAFSGRVTQVCVGHKSKKIEPVPEKFREALLATRD